MTFPFHQCVSVPFPVWVCRSAAYPLSTSFHIFHKVCFQNAYLNEGNQIWPLAPRLPLDWLRRNAKRISSNPEQIENCDHLHSTPWIPCYPLSFIVCCNVAVFLFLETVELVLVRACVQRPSNAGRGALRAESRMDPLLKQRLPLWHSPFFKLVRFPFHSCSSPGRTRSRHSRSPLGYIRMTWDSDFWDSPQHVTSLQIEFFVWTGSSFLKLFLYSFFSRSSDSKFRSLF